MANKQQTGTGFTQLFARPSAVAAPATTNTSKTQTDIPNLAGLVSSTPAPPTLSSSEDFETMVGDLRRVFLAWLKRTEVELERERQRLASEASRGEEERRRAETALAVDRQRQLEQLREERKRAETEMQSQLRQVTVEREESRKKLLEDRAKFEAEMKLERERLSMAKDGLTRSQAEFEKFKQNLISASPTETPVRLNVGGQIFITARKTLLDGARSSDATIAQLAGASEAEVFVDRDGEIFRDLLNCVRTKSAPRPKDLAHSDALFREAAFYGVALFPVPLSFVLGGATLADEAAGGGVLRTAELLTATEGVATWRAIRAMHTERLFAAGCGVRQKILMAGGQNLEYAALADCEVYDALIDVWLQAPELRSPRRNAQAVALEDGRTLVIGGFDGERILASVECLDLRMSGWMQMPSLTTPRSSAGVTVDMAGKRVVTAGGTSGERLKTVEMFDVRAHKWETAAASMNSVRSAGALVSAGERIFAVGGIDGANSVVASMEMFDPEIGSWNFRSSPIEARVDAAACGVDNSILLVGGQNGEGEILASAEIYDVFNDQWLKAPDMVFPRYGHCVVSLVL